MLPSLSSLLIPSTRPFCVLARCSSNFNIPEFDWNYLLRDASIEENIVHRKGVGDIRKLRKLAADAGISAIPTATSSSSPKLPPTLRDEAWRIPNATHPDVPVGDESKSRVVDLFNAKPTYSFPPKTHLEIGNVLKGLRTEGVGVTTGKKSYYLMNDLATLERGLIKYALSALRRAGFCLISVPDILRDDVIRRCGFETDNVQNNAVYKVRLPSTAGGIADDGVNQEEEFCLSGTAEMGIAGYLKDKIFDASELPLKMAAVSRCFRSEMSTRVIDKGLYRVLQFTKVEMFCLTRGDVEESERTLAELLRIQKEIFEPLGICCRVLEMSTEELGAPAYHKYDVEAWIESRDSFSEISSTSNCTDYQSRRLGFRYKDADGAIRHCHSLNGTACAVPRMIQTILEHHQLENGEVTLPQALVPFCRGKRKLELKPEWPVYFFKDYGERIPSLNTRDKKK